MKWTVSKAMLSAVNNMRALGWAVDHVYPTLNDNDEITGIRSISYVMPAPAQIASDYNPRIAQRRVMLSDGSSYTVYCRIVFCVLFENNESPRGQLNFQVAEKPEDFSNGYYNYVKVMGYEAKDFDATIRAWVETADAQLTINVWDECLGNQDVMDAMTAIANGIAERNARELEEAQTGALIAGFVDVMTSFYGGTHDVTVKEGGEAADAKANCKQFE